MIGVAVGRLQKHIKHGEFLWELLHPKDKDGLPGRSASGRYKVKLFVLVSLRHTATAAAAIRNQYGSNSKQAERWLHNDAGDAASCYAACLWLLTSQQCNEAVHNTQHLVAGRKTVCIYSRHCPSDGWFACRTPGAA
jgi:hypothetical protein